MSKRLITMQHWAIVSAAASSVLVLTSLLLYWASPIFFRVPASTASSREVIASPPVDLGPRYQLTYEQWVMLLGREAKVAAEDRPERLTVLAGDSLSLWFPAELLPTGVTWLNQGISGETSYGLLRRLKLFDATDPKTILVMIGINDLIKGVWEETLLANHREIVRHLKKTHPRARIIVQSILPHGGQMFQQKLHRQPWETRLAEISNQHIRTLNQRLATIAHEEKVMYLDLHPHFTNQIGDLRSELTTDGLHLSPQGYLVWQAQLQALTLQVVE